MELVAEHTNEVAPLLKTKPGEYAELLDQLRNGITFVVSHLDDTYAERLGIAPDEPILSRTYVIQKDDAPRIRSLKAMLNCAYHIFNALNSLNNNGYKIKVLAYDLPQILLDIRGLDIGSDFALMQDFLTDNLKLFTDQFNKFRQLDGNSQAIAVMPADIAFLQKAKGWSNYFIVPMKNIEDYIARKSQIDLPEKGKFCQYVEGDKHGNSPKAIINIMRHTTKIMEALDKGITVDPNDTWASIKGYDGYRYYAILQEVLSIASDFDHLDTDQIKFLVEKTFRREMGLAQHLLFSLAFSIDQFEVDLGLKPGTLFDKFAPLYQAFFETSPNPTLQVAFMQERIERRQILLEEHKGNIEKRQAQITQCDALRLELSNSTRIASAFDLPMELINKLCDLFDINNDLEDNDKRAALINLCSNSLIGRCQAEAQAAAAAKAPVGFLGNIANICAHKLGYKADTGYAFCQEMSELLTIRKKQCEDDNQQSTLTSTILEKRIKEEDSKYVAKVIEKATEELMQPIKKPAEHLEPIKHIPPLPAPKPKAKTGLVKLFFGLIAAFFKDVFRAIGNWFKKVFSRKAKPQENAIPFANTKSSYQRFAAEKGLEPGSGPSHEVTSEPDAQKKAKKEKDPLKSRLLQEEERFGDGMQPDF